MPVRENRSNAGRPVAVQKFRRWVLHPKGHLNECMAPRNCSTAKSDRMASKQIIAIVATGEFPEYRIECRKGGGRDQVIRLSTGSRLSRPIR
jgi:hypothetical protein